MAKRVTRLQKLKQQPSTVRNRQRSNQWTDAFAEYLQRECHLAENTVAAYRRDLQRFELWRGNRQIQRLKISQLSDYVGWLADQDLAPTSVARHLVTLKMFFKFVDGGVILRQDPPSLDTSTPLTFQKRLAVDSNSS